MEQGALITGVVVDREGRPLPGAIVRAESDVSESNSVCDEQGRFRLEAPHGKTIWVWSDPDGHAPGSACVVAPAKDVRIAVTPESVLVGRVVERSTGRPLSNVRVFVERSIALEVADPSVATTDAEGRFRLGGLPPGRYEPSVRSDDWRGKAASVALGYRETSREIRIEVSRAPAVRGRVLLPEPLRRRGFVRLIAEDGGRRSGTIEEDGSFEVRGVDPGRWQINIDAAPFIEVAPRQLDIEEDLNEVILPVRRGARITGAVLDSRLETVDGASVALFHGGWGLAPTEQEGGIFAYEGIRPGRYRLTATSNGALGRASAEMDVAIGNADVEGLELILRSRSTSTLRGRIVDTAGNPISRGTATLHAEEEDDDFDLDDVWSSSSTDGTFVFEGTEPGVYTLVPERLGLGEMMKPDGTSARVEVELQEGQDVEVEIVVELSDQTIRGRAVDTDGEPFPGVLVAVARESEDRDEYEEALTVARNDESVAVLTNEQGCFEIESLARGTYTVVAYRPEGEELIARGVRTDQRVTLMLEPPGGLSGKVSGATEFELTARRAPQFDRTETIASRKGSWSIDGLSPGKWSLQIVAAQASAAISAIVRAGRTSDLGKIVLQPFGTVRGQVIDDSGAPLAGAEVVALSTHPRTIHAETDGNGWYQIRVPAGWVHVDVPYGHHGPTRGEVRSGETIELPPIRLN
jgi:protocatechuate 3,4-dioxygenase beta subunit